jgi:hypothetical protein
MGRKKKVPPPVQGLGPAGTELWSSIMDFFVLDREPGKLAVLAQACRVADTLVVLEKALDGQPLVVKGSAMQPVTHPLVDSIRSQRALMASLISQLKLPEDLGEDEDLAAAEARRIRARNAAVARWSRPR